MIVILIENYSFFSTRYTMTQQLLHFLKKLPLPQKTKKSPLKFWNPQFSVQEPHKHIFVMTKKEYFCNSSLFLSSEPKKKLKNPPKKKNSRKIKKLPSLGKAE